MSKLDLFVDCDSTITDSISAYCDVYNNSFYQLDTYFKPADHTKVHTWNLGCQCPLAVDDVETIFGSKQFFDNLKCFPHAKEVLLKLKEKFNLIVVSIGTYENLKYKSEWLDKNLPFCDAILLKNEGVKANKSKVNMAKGLLIDDHQDNLFSSNAMIKFCYGKEFIWNKNWKHERLKDWFEVENRLLKPTN